MEQHSLQAVGGQGFLHNGQKSGKHVFQKRLPPKKDIKRIPHQKLPILPYFSPIFITFLVSQHYGRHVTTPLHRQPQHKGNPAELGGRTLKK